MATTTETLEHEYNRLLDEHADLARAIRKAGEASPEDRKQAAALGRRIREILTIPPQGYELPKAAADLIAHAEAHGWISLVRWTPPGYDGEPSVHVQIGRLLAKDELPDERGRKWLYELSWHSRDCPPGKVRRFGRLQAVTPDHPADGYAPSIRAIRTVIEQHPKPDQPARVAKRQTQSP